MERAKARKEVCQHILSNDDCFQVWVLFLMSSLLMMMSIMMVMMMMMMVMITQAHRQNLARGNGSAEPLYSKILEITGKKQIEYTGQTKVHPVIRGLMICFMFSGVSA